MRYSEQDRLFVPRETKLNLWASRNQTHTHSLSCLRAIPSGDHRKNQSCDKGAIFFLIRLMHCGHCSRNRFWQAGSFVVWVYPSFNGWEAVRNMPYPAFFRISIFGCISTGSLDVLRCSIPLVRYIIPGFKHHARIRRLGSPSSNSRILWLISDKSIRLADKPISSALLSFNIVK